MLAGLLAALSLLAASDAVLQSRARWRATSARGRPPRPRWTGWPTRAPRCAEPRRGRRQRSVSTSRASTTLRRCPRRGPPCPPSPSPLRMTWTRPRASASGPNRRSTRLPLARFSPARRPPLTYGVRRRPSTPRRAWRRCTPRSRRPSQRQHPRLRPSRNHTRRRRPRSRSISSSGSSTFPSRTRPWAPHSAVACARAPFPHPSSHHAC
jgi:hypothetical protein